MRAHERDSLLSQFSTVMFSGVDSVLIWLLRSYRTTTDVSRAPGCTDTCSNVSDTCGTPLNLWKWNGVVNEMNEVSRLQVCSICYTVGYGTGFDSVIGEI